MNFSKINIESPDWVLDEYIYNPFAGSNSEGATLIVYLNENFGEYETATEMKNNCNDEKLKKFFDWLAEKGKVKQ